MPNTSAGKRAEILVEIEAALVRYAGADPYTVAEVIFDLFIELGFECW